MVTLEMSQKLRIAYAGLLESSLVGLLFSDCVQISENNSQNGSAGVTQRLGQGLLSELECGSFDCVVVPFEDFAFYVSKRKSTELRILGCLLGGDTRVIAEVDCARTPTETRRLGAASPGCALMRFDDLSCAQDFEFPCVSSWIPHDRLLEAVQRQSYDFLEVNSFWEAIFGLRLGVLRQTFKMQDYGVPGSRSHLLIINPQNRLVSQQAYQLLRTQILEAYEYTLSSTDKVVSRLTSQMRMASAPTELLNCNVIAASLRVLYPHIAEAHRTRLTLDWQELKLFYRWFYGKIGHSPEQWGVEGPISLEHLVCDTWA